MKFINYILAGVFIWLRLEAVENSDYKKQMVEAIAENKLEKVKYLIESSLVEINESVNEHYHLDTPLIRAIYNHKIDIIKYLIDSKADVNIANKDGTTPLLALIYSAYQYPENEIIQIVKLLINDGAEIDSENTQGETALMAAAFHIAYPKVIQLLIDSGANVNSRSNVRKTPLMYAASSGNVKVLEILIENGANIEAEDEIGQNVFVWALRFGKKPIAKYFINKLNVDVNQKDSTGATPLIRAILANKANMVDLLIEAGADPNIRTSKVVYIQVSEYSKDGFPLFPKTEMVPPESTALTFAKRYGREEIVKILTVAGALD